LKIAKDKGYVTSELVKEKGIPSWYLTDLVKRGMLHRVDRGVYMTQPLGSDEYFIFQYRNKKAIYSYSNALYFHGHTDRIPSRLEVTVYQGYNTHRFDDEVSVHYVKREIYELGITKVKTIYGNSVNVYNMERTLCDLVKSKQIIESEVFKKAFQSYFKQEKKDVGKLMEYARKLDIETEMFTLIEVLA